MRCEAHPGVLPGLDLIEEEDKITHEISWDDEYIGTKASTVQESNLFVFDAEYEANENEWLEIKEEILG